MNKEQLSGRLQSVSEWDSIMCFMTMTHSGFPYEFGGGVTPALLCFGEKLGNFFVIDLPSGHEDV